MTKDFDTRDDATAGVANDCSRPEVTTKYRTAADLANEVLQAVIDKCVAGALIADICKFGDDLIEKKVETMYTKKEKGEKVRKGVAFPTCLSVNEISGHFSPPSNCPRALECGDLVKIHLGCHIDGFIGIGAHTIVIPTAEGTPETVAGRKADVVQAAWSAAEAALRTISVGAKSSAVVSVMENCVKEFKCNLVEGVTCHQLKQHVIEGVKTFPLRESEDEKASPVEFEMNEVYAINVIVSTGDGKLRQSDMRTTVFRRDVEQNYALKTPLARQFLREVTSRFPTLPFSARQFEDEKMSSIGISECLRHELLQPYPVLYERQGEYIAQFSFTVMLLHGGTKKVTGLPLAQKNITFDPTYQIQNEEIVALLATSANPKRKKKKSRDEVKKTAETVAAPGVSVAVSSA